MNALLATQARTDRARIVAAYSAGIGHDTCKLPVLRWVKPTVPVGAAAPHHPNLAGMQATKRVLKRAVLAR